MSSEIDKYIRISTILAQWDRFGMIDPAILEAKTKIGQNVHSAINGETQGFYIPLDSKEEGYFKSFADWKSRTSCIIYQSEILLLDDELGIRGTLDALVKIPGTDKLILVDYKTSAQEDSKFWKLQGMFYHYLATKSGMNLDDRFLFLKLDKEGKGPKVCEYKTSPALWNTCKAALACYKYINGLH